MSALNCPQCDCIRTGIEDNRIIFPCGLMLYQADEEKVPGTECRNAHLQRDP